MTLCCTLEGLWGWKTFFPRQRVGISPDLPCLQWFSVHPKAVYNYHHHHCYGKKAFDSPVPCHWWPMKRPNVFCHQHVVSLLNEVYQWMAIKMFPSNKVLPLKQYAWGNFRVQTPCHSHQPPPQSVHPFIILFFHFCLYIHWFSHSWFLLFSPLWLSRAAWIRLEHFYIHEIMSSFAQAKNNSTLKRVQSPIIIITSVSEYKMFK